MRDYKIITIYKNSRARGTTVTTACKGISLRSIVGKVFARVILMRLQKLAEHIYPESQCGFRAERSTIDMILSLRQLQQKCREQHMPLYIAFIDLTKAFDIVSRNGLFKVLPKIGCPPKLLTRREQCSSMAASRSHSKSAVASNKAASLLQCSLALSLACY